MDPDTGSLELFSDLPLTHDEQVYSEAISVREDESPASSQIVSEIGSFHASSPETPSSSDAGYKDERKEEHEVPRISAIWTNENERVRFTGYQYFTL
ncbi:hypothetical protein MMC13_008141 [Lambiella insularis]|nr:hypothetical protein [Lambiella insularis]